MIEKRWKLNITMIHNIFVYFTLILHSKMQHYITNDCWGKKLTGMYYDYIAFCLCNMMAVEIIFICIDDASIKINIMWEGTIIGNCDGWTILRTADDNSMGYNINLFEMPLKVSGITLSLFFCVVEYYIIVQSYGMYYAPVLYWTHWKSLIIVLMIYCNQCIPQKLCINDLN